MGMLEQVETPGEGTGGESNPPPRNHRTASVSRKGERRHDQDVPVIDRAHLARFTLGDLPLELEVLGLFLDQTPLTLRQLAEATTHKAWRDAAHTLKGSAWAVGAGWVGNLAERAEALKPLPQGPARAEVIRHLEAAVQEARHYIEAMRATTAA